MLHHEHQQQQANGYMGIISPHIYEEDSSLGLNGHSSGSNINMRVQPESLYSAPFTEQVDSIDSQELKTNKKIGRTCISEGCSTQASFRFPNEKDNVYCAKHKLSGMIDYRSRKCEHPDCTTIASFNFFGLKKRRFCKLHAEPGMLYVRRKILPPHFDMADPHAARDVPQDGSASPSQQKRHTDKRKCEFEGCTKSASFNVAGSRKRRFCKSHSEPGMEYVNKRKVTAAAEDPVDDRRYVNVRQLFLLQDDPKNSLNGSDDNLVHFYDMRNPVSGQPTTEEEVENNNRMIINSISNIPSNEIHESEVDISSGNQRRDSVDDFRFASSFTFNSDLTYPSTSIINISSVQIDNTAEYNNNINSNDTDKNDSNNIAINAVINGNSGIVTDDIHSSILHGRDSNNNGEYDDRDEEGEEEEDEDDDDDDGDYGHAEASSSVYFSFPPFLNKLNNFNDVTQGDSAHLTSGNNDNLLINGSNLDIMSESGGVSLQQQQPITLSIQDVDGNNSNGILIAERRGYNRLTDMDSNGNIFERENLAELQIPSGIIKPNSPGPFASSGNQIKYKSHYYCEVDGCQVLASCNYPLESKKRFCGRHKLDGMVILNKPKCAFPGGDCNVRPSFNYPGENKKPQFCFSHCLQGMENVTRKGRKRGSKVARIDSISSKDEHIEQFNF